MRRTLLLVQWILLAIAAPSYLVDHAASFPSRCVVVSRQTTRGSGEYYYGRNPVLGSGGPALASLNDENDRLDAEKEPMTTWTMEEDWALLDNLPLFTMSTGTETKTFWTQLWSANPVLFSIKQPEDLYRRTIELQQQKDTGVAHTSKKSNNGKQGSQPSLVFGDSPPVLENWKLDLDQQDNRVVGQIGERDVGGRRTIWFRYHSIGRLEGDPFADESSSSSSSSSSAVSLFPGGYIEAVGGRIYELGQPMLIDDEWGKKDASDSGTNNEQIGRGGVRGDDDESSSILSRWWLPGSTAAMSALVSAAILSACIGYGAGLSINHDQPSHYRATQPTPTMMTVETVLAGPSNSNGVKKLLLPQSSSYTGTTTKSFTVKTASDLNQKPTTEEVRARTQYRILREERVLKKISQQLEIDKQNLQQLDDQQQSSGLRP